jgi:hypothetical protein
MAINEGLNAIFDNTQDSKEIGNKAVGSTNNYIKNYKTPDGF